METAQQARQAIDFAEFNNKMVDLTRYVDEGGERRLETVQGRVIEGNELGFIFKRRSQRTQDLVEGTDVVDIKVVESVRLLHIGQKHLKPVQPTSVRRHLVDFHGMRRSEVEKMGLEAAMRKHDEIDHSDLGHDHEGAAKSGATSEGIQEKDQVLSRIQQLRRSA